MAEENQAQQELKELQRVTTKDPKKVEAGKRLAAINHKKREVKKREETQNDGMNQYYGIGAGAVIAVGVIGGLGYYIYRTKKGEVPKSPAPRNPPQQPWGRSVKWGPVGTCATPVHQTNKFDMD